MKYNIVEDAGKMTRSNRLFTLGVFGVAALLMFGLAITANAATIDTQLQFGSRGTEVTELQTYLAANPQFYPQGLVTGYYGPLTVAAVKRFQAYYGISQVGRVGPITMAKLNSLMGGVVSGGADVTAPWIFPVAVTASRNNASLTWTTDTQSTGRVFYGTSPLMFTEVSSNYTAPTVTSGQATSDTGAGTAHSITISGLNPGTVYHYFVRNTDASGNVSITWPTTFQTAN